MTGTDDVRYLDARPTIEVADHAAALSFFTGTCGLGVEVTMGEPTNFAIIGAGQAQVAVVAADDPPPPGNAAVYFTITGLDPLVARFESAGVEIVVAPTTRPWGLRDVVVRVPGGGPLVAFGEPT